MEVAISCSWTSHDSVGLLTSVPCRHKERMKVAGSDAVASLRNEIVQLLLVLLAIDLTCRVPSLEDVLR